MHIQLIRADLTSLKVDAIVNPTNPQLQHVGGIGRELVREGGAEIQRESVAQTPLLPGTAIVTTGGNLLCRFVIHTVVPRMGEGDEDAKLRAATWAALEKAEDLAVAAVAFPAMATGPFGFTVERCARTMLGATVDFRPRARSLQRVVYCLFGKDPHETFQRVLQELGT
jgi:O-acetyl-ADP-ribose deacetylase (regulator of RNase III)